MSQTNALVELEYTDHVARLRQTDATLATDVASFTGISSVLGWMQGRGLAQARVDIIGQDEFHYDFLIEMEAGGRWVSFGVT